MSLLRILALAGRALLCAIAVAAVSGCKEEILHGLSEREANRLVAQLYLENIEVSKDVQADGTWAVAVSKHEAVRAISLLESKRLLRGATSVENRSTSVLQTREESRIQYERALSATIESSMSSLPGILEARVHLNLPPVDPLLGLPLKGVTGSASVLIVHQRGSAISAKDIARLVSGASGIPDAQVNIILSAIVSTADEVGSTPPQLSATDPTLTAAPRDPLSQPWSGILLNKVGQGVLSLVLFIAGIYLLIKKDRSARRVANATLSAGSL